MTFLCVSLPHQSVFHDGRGSVIFAVISPGLKRALSKLSLPESWAGPEHCLLRAHSVAGKLTAQAVCPTALSPRGLEASHGWLSLFQECVPSLTVNNSMLVRWGLDNATPFWSQPAPLCRLGTRPSDVSPSTGMSGPKAARKSVLGMFGFCRPWGLDLKLWSRGTS